MIKASPTKKATEANGKTDAWYVDWQGLYIHSPHHRLHTQACRKHTQAWHRSRN